MARIRTIKPEFFTSNDIVSLTPLARLFYVALWCESDREGRLSWNLRTFKLRYFPGDDCAISDLSNELVEAGLVIPYEVDGKPYAEIPTFAEHQVINNRESQSVIPPRAFDASGTRESGVLGEGKEGREGKGKEGKERTGASAPSPESLFPEADPGHLRDWVAARKVKRLPLTETAAKGFRRSAEKAGMTVPDAVKLCAERGWAGLNSNWQGAQPNGGSPAPRQRRQL